MRITPRISMRNYAISVFYSRPFKWLVYSFCIQYLNRKLLRNLANYKYRLETLAWGSLWIFKKPRWKLRFLNMKIRVPRSLSYLENGGVFILLCKWITCGLYYFRCNNVVENSQWNSITLKTASEQWETIRFCTISSKNSTTRMEMPLKDFKLGVGPPWESDDSEGYSETEMDESVLMASQRLWRTG